MQKIVKELEYNNGIFPERALTKAIQFEKEITPHLLQILKQCNSNAQAFFEQKNYMAHIYAMFLLAQFREKLAYPLIINFLLLPENFLLGLLGGITPQYLARILASVSGGDDSLMKDIVENERVSADIREGALKGITALVLYNKKSREEILDYYKSLFRGKLIRKPSRIWKCLVSCSNDLYPAEVYEDIENAYKEGLIESCSLKDARETLSLSKKEIFGRLKKNNQYQFIEDTILEMQFWSCFALF